MLDVLGGDAFAYCFSYFSHYYHFLFEYSYV